ncbi:type II toxin-antitoxin system RelE/ParE family toxin [Algoriphagus sp. D3-2-R+10]|uniref:type II toxin-antitoxin system RelE/ParE family toxin n=1 Tax=Algoriphagus aurantiacus TaxID=3103948 RepID=UPI002B3F8B78|nr:type II toxin-antitoxin system RelE/ParE family toxin [Algoriphagus sp. D3-2-R+10]MEB2775034.1 type II toxin-antitoxin system RelE/ParE family toxin [Algoriphagus sp. D3-2-R+10]
MSYEVILTPDFKKFFKRLYKKYPSLRNDLFELIQKLEYDFQIGVPLGSNLYKIRLSIESKNKGKSGGARVIYYFLSQNNEIYMIHIFDKSDFDNIPKEKLLELLRSAGLID